MRTLMLGLLLGSVIAAALFAMAQSARPRETIWLGTDLTLGMPEDAVVARLAASHDLEKMEPPPALRAKGITSMWVVNEKGEGNQHSTIGLVTFSMGKLRSVRKDLLPPNGDEVEFGRQLYFVMHDLELEGDSHCDIDTEATEVPNFAHKTAKVQCGKKSVMIDLQKFKGKDESVQLYEEMTAP